MTDTRKWWLGFVVGAVLSALIGIVTAFQTYRSAEIQQRQLELQANEKLSALVKDKVELEKKIVAQPQDNELIQIVQQLGKIMSSLADEQKKYIASGQPREITDLMKQVAEMQNKAAQFHQDSKAKDKQIAELRNQLAVAQHASTGATFANLGVRTVFDNIGTKLTEIPSPAPQTTVTNPPFGQFSQEGINKYQFPRAEPKSLVEETLGWIKQVPGGLIVWAVIIIIGIVVQANKK
jgi:hypothetical protein